jgi:hypothetical protein
MREVKHMGKKETEKDYDLDALLEKENDPEKRKVLEFFKDMAMSKDSKKAKLLGELEQLDTKLRTALSLVLNYYATEQTFNQQLLEDAAVLIIKRSKIVKKIK